MDNEGEGVALEYHNHLKYGTLFLKTQTREKLPFDDCKLCENFILLPFLRGWWKGWGWKWEDWCQPERVSIETRSRGGPRRGSHFYLRSHPPPITAAHFESILQWRGTHTPAYTRGSQRHLTTLTGPKWRMTIFFSAWWDTPRFPAASLRALSGHTPRRQNR